MNRKEHLLTILAEECSEIQHATCKALRFGLNDMGPAKKLTNALNIQIEYIQLTAVIDMLIREGHIDFDEELSMEEIKKKNEAVEHYLKYAKERGTLDD